MTNYHKLNLITDPLKVDHYLYDSYHRWSVETDIKKILNDDLYKTFEHIGVIPTVAIFFIINSNKRLRCADAVHVDRTWINNEWVSIPFAINWELNPIITTRLSWYDISNCELKPPGTQGAHIEYPYNYLNGEFFLGDKTEIDSVVLEKNDLYHPILIRTDVAHNVSEYKTTERKRFCLSLRFDIEQIKSWEQATNIFKDYIITDI